MELSLIELETSSGIATLALNRPQKRNAISDAMRAELIEALELVANDPSIRALVITGRGNGFCAGGDIAGMQQRLQAPAGQVAFNGWARQQGVHHAQTLLYAMPKPTIAAVNGPATGLGADLALACDFIMASDAASFAWSYIHRGLIPDGGGMYFLPRRVGLSLAKELIFTGRKVAAQEAVDIGLVDRQANAETLLAQAQAWAAELSHGSAPALALGKSILNQSFQSSAQQIFALGSQAQGMCYTSTEHHQAVADFLASTVTKG